MVVISKVRDVEIAVPQWPPLPNGKLLKKILIERRKYCFY